MEVANSFRNFREGVWFALFFCLLFCLQTKTINTGDAGELVTAAYGLGIAHPSGYSVYLMVSKFLTFLPFGSIPMKVALVSSVSSAVLLVLGMKFLEGEGFDFISQLFFALLLLSCYSFFGQSLLAKFYPLNTLLIFIIFYLGYKSLYQYEVKYQHLVAFLLGIAAGLHQTTYFMFIPLLVPVIWHLKKFIKNFLVSFLLFILGFSDVLYLTVRSWKDTLLNMSPSGNLALLVHTLLRKAYGTSSSVDVAKSVFHLNLNRILYAVKNSFILLSREFHPYIFLFFLLGLVYLWIRNKRLFWYLVLSFVSYSFLLAYFTFSSKSPDLDAWYICAHQYYLPLFLFSALISAYGFEFIVKKLTPKLAVVKYLLLCFPLVYLPQHLFLNNYDKNQVAYYKTIDQFFVKPIKSVVIYSGDNDVFQGWYLKNVEKFRDDLCLISTPTIADKIWGISNGCNCAIYKKAYPEVCDKKSVFNLARLRGYMLKKRVYSSTPIEENKILKKHVKSDYVLFDFMILPKDVQFNEVWAAKQREKYKEFIHYNTCLNHGTDDDFTKALCSKYATYLTYLAYDIGQQSKSGATSKIDLHFGKHITKALTIKTNKKNSFYLYRAYQISKFNDLKKFYLYSGF